MEDGQVNTLLNGGLGVVGVFDLVLKMLSLCGVCSTDHVARFYSHRKEPRKRAWEVVKVLRDDGYVESWRYGYDKPSVHRLTKEVRKSHGLKCVRWDGKLEHKLAITDVFLDLGCPDTFIREYRFPFVWRRKRTVLSPDACVTIGNTSYFIEVQRSSIVSNEWAKKRRNYELLFMGRLWEGTFRNKPEVIVITDQQRSTIGDGLGYDMHVVKNINELIKSPIP